MANIRRRKGKWNVQVRKLGQEPVSGTFLSKTHALKFAKQVESDMEQGKYLNLSMLGKITFKNIIHRYRNEKIQNTTHVSWYRSNNLLNHRISNKNLANLSSTDFADYKKYRLEKVSASTVNRELSLASKIIKTATIEYGIHLPINPVHSSLKMRENPHRTRLLESNEIERLLEAMGNNNQMKSIFIIALNTGMRKSEIINARREHINIFKRTWLIPHTKNGESRVIPINDTVINIINGTDSIQNLNGKLFNVCSTSFWENWDRYRRRAGLDNVRFHDCRRYAITKLLESGLFSETEVTAISGHKTMQQLKTYTNHKVEKLADKLKSLGTL